MPDFNALMDPAQIGQGVSNNIFAGYQFARGAEAQNALAKYAENPSMETARAVAPHDPRASIQVQGLEEQRMARQAAAERQARIAQLAPLAAQGDKKALAALWSDDVDLAMKIDDRQAQVMTDSYEFMANAAFDIVRHPENERPVKWDEYIRQGMNMGLGFLGQYLGKYDEAALNAFVSKAEEMQQFQQFQRPKGINLQPGGGYYEQDPITGQVSPVVVPNPGGAVPFTPAQDMPRVTSPQEAMNLPPGTQFIDPQGQVRVVPGGTAGNGGGNFPGQGN